MSRPDPDHAPTDQGLTRDTSGTPPARTDAAPVDESVGPYRLLQVLGEGGFGIVYRAAQSEPIRREVALKIIKPGMDSAAVIARFEAERQALAVMDHPNVARVFDAGITPSGRPYFSMELIRGEPITAFADRQALDLPGRIALMVQVCEAVQHAHTKGIIHRDLKPSNILVAYDGEGRATVKVIDFGVAKALNQRLSANTIFTSTGQMIGTPEYMSPEQAEMSGLDVDTRTDVYSLGMVLYELLTGQLPFDPRSLRSAALGEIQRMIREVEPPKPSTRLARSGESAAGRARTRAMATALRGELDWVVMKCLEKDRARRYPTPNALAAELIRYLGNEPVLARPPSATYRIGKFVRRRKGLVTALAVVAITMLAGVAASLWQARVAREQRDRAVEAEARQRLLTVAESDARRDAEFARRKAETTSAFVIEALNRSDPNQGGRQGVLVTEAMQAAAAQLDRGQFQGEPAIEASLRAAIAVILSGNGRSEDAVRHAERAVALLRDLPSASRVELPEALGVLGMSMTAAGRAAQAEPHFVEALDLTRRQTPPDERRLAGRLADLAFVRWTLGRAADAEPLHIEALAIRRRILDPDHADLFQSINGLATVYEQLGRLTEAEPLMIEALDAARRIHTGDHPYVADALNNLAMLRKADGRIAEAEPLLVESLGMRRRVFAGDHPTVAQSLNNLANVREMLGRPAEAEPLYTQSLDMVRRLYPGDHPEVARTLNNVGSVRRALGRPEEAEPLFVESLAMTRRLYPGDHPSIAGVLGNLASLRRSLGRLAEAEPLYEEALAMNRRLYPGDHPQLAQSMNNLAVLRLAQGRRDEATTLIDAAADMILRVVAPDHPLAKRILDRQKEIHGG
ncbi:MAG: tetratricopeptide repeat protein [Phycisphaerae bacterium]|nr:tetratricopeptide repeat protein [Phycisphaerae bacterium]